MAGFELYAPRQARHRRTWTAAAVPLTVVFIFLATLPVAISALVWHIVSSRHGMTWGVIANTIVFSALHALNIPSSPELLLGLVNILLVGVFLSLYAVRERALWGVCAWHSAWNWLLGVGFGLRVSGETLDVSPLFIHLGETTKAPWWLSGGHFGPEDSVVTSAVLLTGVIYLLHTGVLRQGNSYSVAKSGPSTGALAQNEVI